MHLFLFDKDLLVSEWREMLYDENAGASDSIIDQDEKLLISLHCKTRKSTYTVAMKPTP